MQRWQGYVPPRAALPLRARRERGEGRVRAPHGRRVGLRLSTSAMRTIEKHGGLDAFLMQARNAELADEARQLKREIKAAQAAN